MRGKSIWSGDRSVSSKDAHVSKPPGTRQESLIRAVNERIREISAGQERFEVHCECGEANCRETLDVTAAEYEEIRGAASSFLVAPGHERASGGVVVLERETHRVVAVAGSDSELVA